MKLLSIAVPCYNSEDYMRHCIDSLLPGGSDVEILIINDGSVDGTAAIADEYEARFPGIVRAIHQVNGGHGAAVNTGIQNAIGLFFKVVDSDDWVDAEAYHAVLKTLRGFGPQAPDMLLANYVYEKEGKKRKKVMRYANVLPTGKLFTWRDIGRFHKGQYILMHSIIYKTSLLHESGLQLPRHTFYVDNLYAYIPMARVQTMFYLDVNFYRYYIGRDGQSVQEQTMIRRIDQQLLVNRLMATSLDISEMEEPCKRSYLFNYLEIVTMVSTVLLIKAGTEEHLAKRRDLYSFLQAHDKKLYRKIRYGMLGTVLNLPGNAGRKVSVSAYRVTQKVVGFN